MHKLIPTTRKRLTTCITDIWNEASTTIWIKFTGSSASNRKDMKPNNRKDRHPYSGVVGVKEEEKEDRRRRSANTGRSGKKTSSEQSQRRFPKTWYAPYPVQGREET